MTVMDIDFEAEAQAMVDRLVNNSLDQIAAFYMFPAVIYFGEELLIFRDAKSMQRALERYRSVLEDAGLAKVTSRVVQAPKVPMDRFKLAVVSTYFGGDGRTIGTARIRYFVENKCSCPKIRMVDWCEWPCADRIKELGGFREFAI